LHGCTSILGRGCGSGGEAVLAWERLEASHERPPNEEDQGMAKGKAKKKAPAKKKAAKKKK
jgi:hypothetical protein